MMARSLPALAAVLVAFAVASCAAQSVQQSGAVTAGHAPRWVTNGVLGDAGTSAGGAPGSYLTTLGVTASGGTPFCVNSGPATSAYTAFCFGADTSTGAFVYDTSTGGATHVPLKFIVNGNTSLTLTDSGSTLANPTITGGSITGATLNGYTLAYSLRVVTAAGAVTVVPGDYWVIINKTVEAATHVTLPTTASPGTVYRIKDGKGDAGKNAITITAGGTLIDGSATAYINSNHGVLSFVYDGNSYDTF